MFIVVTNVILTNLTVNQVNKIGYPTHSKTYTQISFYIFVATFFNTGVVILIANAALGEKIPLVAMVFSGLFNDYSFDWYGNVGNQIVVSMIINALVAIIEHLVQMCFFWRARRKDQAWEKDPERAKYTT